MNLTKLNKNYEADPNIGSPEIEIFENTLSLKFFLNSSKFAFKEDQKGTIKFINCVMFRVGSPNDEGFFYSKIKDNIKNDSIWNTSDFPEIEWDNFYEVQNTPKDHFSRFYKIEDYQNLDNLHHYVFFMKEATFECLAESYTEHI